jgi:hypothetical protein
MGAPIWSTVASVVFELQMQVIRRSLDGLDLTVLTA